MRGVALVTAFQSGETSTWMNIYLYWGVHIRWERWVATAGRGADLKFDNIWSGWFNWRSKRPQSADWEVGEERERERERERETCEWTCMTTVLLIERSLSSMCKSLPPELGAARHFEPVLQVCLFCLQSAGCACNLLDFPHCLTDAYWKITLHNDPDLRVRTGTLNGLKTMTLKRVQPTSPREKWEILWRFINCCLCPCLKLFRCMNLGQFGLESPLSVLESYAWRKCGNPFHKRQNALLLS